MLQNKLIGGFGSLSKKRKIKMNRHIVSLFMVLVLPLIIALGLFLNTPLATLGFLVLVKYAGMAEMIVLINAILLKLFLTEDDDEENRK